MSGPLSFWYDSPMEKSADDIYLKRCTRCFWEWPAAQWFHKAGNMTDGYHTVCKGCRGLNKTFVERRGTGANVASRAQASLRTALGTAWCSSCQRCAAPNKGHGRCVRCNRRHARAQYSTPEGRARQRAWQAVNKDKMALYHRRWLERNPEKAKQRATETQHRRRARLYGAFVAPVSRALVWERCSGLCGICGRPAEADDWHLDHIIPLARGGTHEPANTQVAHPACNRKKHVTMPNDDVVAAVLSASESAPPWVGLAM